MIRLLPDSWKILSYSERVDFVKTGLSNFLSSLLDLALVSLTVPFINALNGDSRPNSIILPIFRFFRAEAYYKQNTASAILLLLFGVLFIRFLFKMLANELEKRFKNKVTSRLTSLLYEIYITDTFEFDKKNESNHLINNLNNIRQINDFIYEPWLKIYHESISILLIFLYLLVISPITTLMGVTIVGLLLVIYQSSTKKKTTHLADLVLKSDRSTLKIIKDSFLLISEIKIYHKEKFFEQIFKESVDSGITSRNQTHQFQVMGPVALEFLGLSTCFFIISLALQTDNTGKQLIPIISSFVIALFRIIPGASGLQSALHRINYGKQQVRTPISQVLNYDKNLTRINSPIKSDHKWTYIIFDNVRFSYSDSNTRSISCPYLKIERGSFTGVVGSSGAGKSTFVQLLSGLLKPNSGQINFWDSEFNQVDLSQITVGYVPQEVHLLNASLSANVGFGLGEEEIDYDRVANCLRDVQLDYLQDRFDLRNNQPMGEDGSSISGGERQRIGLARALYLNPSLLILDEVTSSLDSTNEALILDLISELSQDVTTIFVSHHIEAIKRCDHLVKIENGQVSFKARI